METQNAGTNVQGTVGQTAENRIRKTHIEGELQVTRVYKSDWQKEGTMSAEIKQTVETKSFYPTKSVSNDMQDNIFGTSDFGFSEQEFSNTETRVSFLDVPSSATVESVQEQLKKFPKARNYKVLSNRPILTTDQKYAVEVGLTTEGVIANRQAVRYPDNAGEDAGKLVLDPNGKIQYRQIYFSKDGKEDIDVRTSAPEDFFVSEELQAELEESGQIKL